MRSAKHKQRMAERRERQLARTATHMPFGRKLIRQKIIDDNGLPQIIVFGVERQDEQKAYRQEHWNHA